MAEYFDVMQRVRERAAVDFAGVNASAIRAAIRPYGDGDEKAIEDELLRRAQPVHPISDKQWKRMAVRAREMLESGEYE